MIDPKALDELLAVCRKHNVMVFTDGNVRIAFGVGVELQKHEPAQRQGHRKMTDTERFLFAATEGYPDDDEAFVPVQTEPKQ